MRSELCIRALDTKGLAVERIPSETAWCAAKEQVHVAASETNKKSKALCCQPFLFTHTAHPSNHPNFILLHRCLHPLLPSLPPSLLYSLPPTLQ